MNLHFHHYVNRNVASRLVPSDIKRTRINRYEISADDIAAVAGERIYVNAKIVMNVTMPRKIYVRPRQWDTNYNQFNEDMRVFRRYVPLFVVSFESNQKRGGDTDEEEQDEKKSETEI
ncbi:hypothetical protein GWI33_002377 [Rhynchophorus ferrugineus]|uniref:Uncharacterized protein n=1 Tax=Rhynchophorus ferrugineus TaxID=354439 RepID=A0A834IR47_RHYFE|nr:hypothetical protein GWI33_002377 [Rhynchophorus ferrugineus]